MVFSNLMKTVCRIPWQIAAASASIDFALNSGPPSLSLLKAK